MENSVLQIDNLQVGYQGIPLISNLNLTCYNKEIVTFIGINGTGKSCLLKSIIGIIPCLKGDIFLNGYSIINDSLYQKRKHGINLCPEGRMIFPNLTVAENLKTGLAIEGMFYKNYKEKIKESYGLFPKLYERRNQLAGTLSGGEQQLLALARASIIKPTLLLLDEPTLGLSRFIIDSIIKIIYDLSKSDITIMLTDQNDSIFKEISSKIIVLNDPKYTN